MEGESRESLDGGNTAKNKDGALFWGDGLLVLRKHFYKCTCPEEGCGHYVWRSWTWAVRLTEFCSSASVVGKSSDSLLAVHYFVLFVFRMS